MPIEIGFWNITNGNPNKIHYSPLDSEKRLEDILTKDISILGDEYLIIGRQVRTKHNKLIDLIAINQEGNLTIIELKKDKTPRQVVAQLLDYASWVKDLSYQDIKSMGEKWNDGNSLDVIFEEKFGTQLPEELNQEHNMLIVASELDNETERIVNYLSDNYNVPINAAFFRVFKDQENEYLSRSWLIDPTEVLEKSSISKTRGKIEPWNGNDFIVNINVDNDGISTWKDSIKYGFISAGGGKWYSNSLKQLFIGARIFAMIPKKGYLGVGKVTEERQPIRKFKIKDKDSSKNILDVNLFSNSIKENPDDLDNCEYLVRIEWIRVKENEEDAYWEKGLKANQNSAFKLRSQFTLTKLIEEFKIEE